MVLKLTCKENRNEKHGEREREKELGERERIVWS